MRIKQVVFIFVLFWGLVVCEETSSRPFCPVPPQPKHGSYKLLHISEHIIEGHPNDFILEVTCDPGYLLTGAQNVSCLAGHWFDEMPECLTKCGKGKNPSVVACTSDSEDNDSRCVLDQEFTTQLNPKSIKLDKDENDCGTEPLVFLKVISGGRPPLNHELPWHAAIYTKETRPYMQICGGTLVSKNTVISAAHCFWSETSQKLQPKEIYAVGLGKLYRPWKEDADSAQKFDVSDIIVPPRYQGSTTNFQDDIAIVILSGEVMFKNTLKPICLSFDPAFDEEQLKPGSLGKVGGWGLTSDDGKASPSLVIAELPYVDVETCIADLPTNFKPYITSDKICAGYTNGTAVCKGDSGGGLVFRAGRRYYLRAVVSTAPGSNHLCNVYTRATFTHVQRHERFIRKHVEFQEAKRDIEKQEMYLQLR